MSDNNMLLCYAFLGLLLYRIHTKGMLPAWIKSLLVGFVACMLVVWNTLRCWVGTILKFVF